MEAAPRHYFKTRQGELKKYITGKHLIQGLKGGLKNKWKNKWRLNKQINNSKYQKLVKKPLGERTGSS